MLEPEAPVNVSDNYNRSKVEEKAALVKSSYMLESLVNSVILRYNYSIEEI